jgi:predicted ATPase
VSVASLGVLRALAASGPVIVAIDDVQWLDVPSARVLAFALRRLEV